MREIEESLEQERVIVSDADALKVKAFAGAGKTTTLVKYAERRRQSKLLYIAFNRPILLQARKKFAHVKVKCMTSHGLAFHEFGSPYYNARKLVTKIRVNEVVRALGMEGYDSGFRLYMADTILKTVDRFMTSDAEDFDEDSIESHIVPGSDIDPYEVAQLSRRLWNRMVDVKDRSIGMVHDGYLKLYALSKPRLTYDTILFDEYQDANPVTANIVASQPCAKVVVGDTHQALYGFRGAIDAMDDFHADETLCLTKSFRFGQGLADVANSILSNFKGETIKLIGTDAPSRIGEIPANERHAFVARSNGTVFNEAVKIIASGKKVGFIGGIEGYRMGEVLDVFNLRYGNKGSIQSAYFRNFKDFDTMDEYGNAVDDKELKSLARAVKNHGARIPNLVNQIKSGTAERPSEVDVWLSTGHKIKGLEGNNVRMADDFMDLMTDKGEVRKLQPSEKEEVNLIYVVATRAKKVLQPNAQLAQLLEREAITSGG